MKIPLFFLVFFLQDSEIMYYVLLGREIYKIWMLLILKIHDCDCVSSWNSLESDGFPNTDTVKARKKTCMPH